MKRRSISLADQEHDALEEISQATKRSFNELVREAIREYLKVRKPVANVNE